MAGQVLKLKVLHDVVTINGNATIVREDFFSQQGVIHIVDQPLLLASPFPGVA